jgi:curli biogenesis system outer membrane secretion channel CsgG
MQRAFSFRKSSLVSLLLALLLFTLSLSAQDKKRVAIMNFEYGAVSSSVAAIFGTNQDVGKGIADLIVDRFVKDGTYSVIERKALDKIVMEQNMSNSDRFDPTSAAKVGKLLGVDAIVIGSITQFGRDDKNTSLGGLGAAAGRFGVGGVGRRESKAVVEISSRMVSVDTGEILAVASGRGESTRSGTTLIGGGGGPGGLGAGGLDMSSRNFGDTILGEAVNKAVTVISGQLEQSAARIPTHTLTIDGLVADVSGSTLVLNVGAASGVRVGQKLQVMRPGREIKDPATGKVLRRTETALGTITITQVDDSSSEGTYAGEGAAKVGDHVKN